MDDSCAVCADNLEWVAYGACGHKEVCSTCVVRLRFICDDKRCCICKAESNSVFITKAMGDYTKMIGDFSTLPSEPREGRVGPYCYHEDTQAFFDDSEHYKMIKAMCRLSCSVCDKEEQPPQPTQEASGGGGYRRRQRFRNVGQLKAHLAHHHKLFMCDLCLEGRKIFIGEQKLYTKSQLNRHTRSGDSEVDGTESERGGFAGHPVCDFCKTSFYGENELYTHMSREHFTCHICQRNNPGKYEYYKDYNDLESHFRQKHFLCEDEDCLTKKFIVFVSAEDLKRHNALEHGGHMSRAKRNAALQIPTSFTYRSNNTNNNESGYHRGRRRSFRREPQSSTDGELSMAIQASLESVNANGALPDMPQSSRGAVEPSGVGSLVQPLESLSTSESEAISRYRQAVSQSSPGGTLQESSFPPLPGAASNNQQRSQRGARNTMAARLKGQNSSTVLNVARPRPIVSAFQPARRPAPASRPAPAPAPQPAPQPAPAVSAPRPAPAIPAPRAAPAIPTPRAPAVATPQPVLTTPLPQAAPAASSPWPALVTSSGSGQTKAGTLNGSGSSSYASSLHGRSVHELGVGGSRTSTNPGTGSRLNHSTSAPNLANSRSYDPVSDFPPVSAVQSNRLHSSGQTTKTEDVKTANKTLVERIQAALDFDDTKYGIFKKISLEYRQDLIDTWEYLEYVKQFDLIHLVPDLAGLCPDVQKQKDLLDGYNTAINFNGSRSTSWGNGNANVKGSSSSKKEKGKKAVDSESSRSKELLADSVMNTVRSLQSQMKPSEEVEVLEKDGYRVSKGKSTLPDYEKPIGGSKQKKKTSKFHRNRLGDDSPAAVLDLRSSTTAPASAEVGKTSGWPNQSEGTSTRGVWNSKGVQKLFPK